MSRSGYTDEIDDVLQYGRYRGRVASTIRGKVGQAFLRELLSALDAMETKELHAGMFNRDGCMCALGVVAAARGVKMTEPEDEYDAVGQQAADALGISTVLANEVMFMNDEGWGETPAERWLSVRNWVVSQIKPQGTANDR